LGPLSARVKLPERLDGCPVRFKTRRLRTKETPATNSGGRGVRLFSPVDTSPQKISERPESEALPEYARSSGEPSTRRRFRRSCKSARCVDLGRSPASGGRQPREADIWEKGSTRPREGGRGLKYPKPALPGHTMLDRKDSEIGSRTTAGGSIAARVGTRT